MRFTDQRPELFVRDDQFGAAILSSKALGDAGLPTAPDQFSLTFRGHAIGLDLISAANIGAAVTLEFTEASGKTSTTVFAVNTGTFVGAISSAGFTQFSL